MLKEESPFAALFERSKIDIKFVKLSTKKAPDLYETDALTFLKFQLDYVSSHRYEEI